MEEMHFWKWILIKNWLNKILQTLIKNKKNVKWTNYEALPMKASKNVKEISRKVFFLKHKNLVKVFKYFNRLLSKAKVNKISNQISIKKVQLFLKRKYVYFKVPVLVLLQNSYFKNWKKLWLLKINKIIRIILTNLASKGKVKNKSQIWKVTLQVGKNIKK